MPYDTANQFNVFLRDRFACQYCGDRFATQNLSLDHVLPRCRGGADSWENVVCACRKCNVQKGGRTPDEARMTLLRRPVKPSRSPIISRQLTQRRYACWRPFLSVLGGEQSFGLGGYYKTVLEEILPVRSDFEKEKEKPSLAMVIVIDKSGSMEGAKIEMAKTAARSAVELLGNSDQIAVVAFDGETYVMSEMQSASNKLRVGDEIGPGPAGLGGILHAVQTELPGAGHDLAGELFLPFPLGGVWGDLLLHEAAHASAQFVVLRGEEIYWLHQNPSIRPITSRITSSVPAPIRISRVSRHARCTGNSIE